MIIEQFKIFIEQKGLLIVKNEQLLKDPVEFTEQVLQFRRDVDNIIKLSYKNDDAFWKASNVSFQVFINCQDKTAYQMAQYVDKKFTGDAINEPEKLVGEIINLFCCLHGRDIFISHYANLLALRLLNKTNVNNKEAERLILNKLKVECGHNTVKNVTTMF